MAPFWLKVKREFQFWKRLFTFFAQWKRTSKLPDWQRLKTESYIEARLYDALKQAGYNVHAQYQIAGYAVDLVLKKERIAIECDGANYHSSPDQKRNDRKKTRVLRKYGWKVLRFTGRQINQNINGVLEKIAKEVLAQKA
ncbi:endonuclease domain-containing protein [Risungbinella massiliensis]|uniref:endonuclease domain-containing protein n=1 Tax=Risungbinella massiliensis TaxID=1329796 RepID=UPI00069972F7|nr:DUF559 domain-containing protein [Risungbinella massiliensis]